MSCLEQMELWFLDGAISIAPGVAESVVSVCEKGMLLYSVNDQDLVSHPCLRETLQTLCFSGSMFFMSISSNILSTSCWSRCPSSRV